MSTIKNMEYKSHTERERKRVRARENESESQVRITLHEEHYFYSRSLAC